MDTEYHVFLNIAVIITEYKLAIRTHANIAKRFHSQVMLTRPLYTSHVCTETDMCTKIYKAM